MSAINNGKIHASARNAGVGVLALLLALTACSPSTPQPGGTSQSAASSGAPPPAPATSTAATSTAAPSASATVPADSDETAPPQSGDKVISSTVALDWTWPGPGQPFEATHTNPVPLPPPAAAPLPTLYAIGAGMHPADTPPYDQLSFRFQGGFPSYNVEFVPELLADASGLPVPMPGTGAILRVVFHGAQAHTADGTASTITSAPAPSIGYPALTSYAPAGDFEGVLTYGIGVGRPMGTVPQTKVRVYEVEKIEGGQHLYVVAIQLDASSWK
ncbi:AMIN-like domain-containing (lipo)protein [Arthrobacter sp. PsM3]|uniref:AMIN-like domain-containing (lipo)protein n=1 Tax=Arthrobacter sp. PsM3 TaxID=3030531 RepID=UPI00263ACC66|nr:hypothetical protein [Arthrobacter sp. PsM3]MDN4645935.1 hypothetical protein [Arthrobacter sp. PsM3]